MFLDSFLLSRKRTFGLVLILEKNLSIQGVENLDTSLACCCYLFFVLSWRSLDSIVDAREVALGFVTQTIREK